MGILGILSKLTTENLRITPRLPRSLSKLTSKNLLVATRLPRSLSKLTNKIHCSPMILSRQKNLRPNIVKRRIHKPAKLCLPRRQLLCGMEASQQEIHCSMEVHQGTH